MRRAGADLVAAVGGVVARGSLLGGHLEIEEAGCVSVGLMFVRVRCEARVLEMEKRWEWGGVLGFEFEDGRLLG